MSTAAGCSGAATIGGQFVAYYVVDTGNDVVASVSVFQDQAGAEESNRMAAGWVKENIASLVSGPPEITASAVTLNEIQNTTGGRIF